MYLLNQVSYFSTILTAPVQKIDNDFKCFLNIESLQKSNILLEFEPEMFIHKKKTVVRRLIATSLLALGCLPSYSVFAQTDGNISQNNDPTLVPVGETLVRPASLIAVAKNILISALQSNLHANVTENAQISFQTVGYDQTLTLPAPTGELKQVLTALGITNETLGISISPVKASFTLPQSAITMNVTPSKSNPDAFTIQASMTLTNIKAVIDTLAIHVPKGAFDKAFDIDSKPVTITLKGNKPVTVIASFTATPSGPGLTFSLDSFKTNLLAKGGANLYATLGSLTAAGLPLTPTLITNGHTLTVSEKQVRTQLQSLEPLFIANIQSKISDALHDQIRNAVKAVAAIPPLKYSVNTTQLLAPMKLQASTSDLLNGINLEFLLNHFSPEQSGTVYDVQLGSRISFDGVSISQADVPQMVGSNLTNFGTSDDVGIAVYEPFVKQFLESPEFQARIQKYFHAIFTGPSGIVLAPSGVKVYFWANANTVAAVINLEIDIRKLITSKTSTGQKIELKLADDIESWLGTGKVVKLPLQFNFQLNGIQNVKGVPNLQITTHLPFKIDLAKTKAQGKTVYTDDYIPTAFCPDTECPTNLDDMTGIVSYYFYPQLRDQLAKALPTSISLPLSKPINYDGVSFSINNISVSQGGSNAFSQTQALLLTGKVQVTPAAGAHK